VHDAALIYSGIGSGAPDRIRTRSVQSRSSVSPPILRERQAAQPLTCPGGSGTRGLARNRRPAILTAPARPSEFYPGALCSPPSVRKIFHLLATIAFIRGQLKPRRQAVTSKGETSIKRMIRRQQLRAMMPLATARSMRWNSVASSHDASHSRRDVSYGI
jgi:hypothetical protein